MTIPLIYQEFGIAKNLYNQINYEFRQTYFWNQYNPDDKIKMPAYCRLAHEFKDDTNSKSLLL
jgi:hypothetical protein